VGIGLREVLVLLIVAPLLLGVIALFLPRKWVSVRVKRWTLAAWIVIGIVQIVDGALYLPSHAGASTMLYGISEVMMFGAGFLMFTETRWKRAVGGRVIFLGLLLVMIAGALRNSAPHG
jgi:hypothetical protein